MKLKRLIAGTRLLAVFALISSGTLAYGGMGGWGSAQPITMEIDLTKGVSSEGESYQVDCLITGTELDKVKSLLLYVPGNKPIKFKNLPGIGEITWKAVRGSFNQFQHDFPAGRYELQAQPKRHGSYAIDLTLNFPPVPNILYPADGAKNVTFPFSITWEPLQGIQDLTIRVAYGYGWLEYGLSPDDTSFEVGQWDFEPGQEYEVTLTGTVTDGKGNKLSTWRKMHFTTAAQ